MEKYNCNNEIRKLIKIYLETEKVEDYKNLIEICNKVSIS